MALLLFMCVLNWGAHKSLAPRARTLLGGLGQAMLSFFAVATLLFFFFCECPKFCDLAKQRRKTFGGVSEVGKDDFSLYFFLAVCLFLGFLFFFCCERTSEALAFNNATADSSNKVRTIPHNIPHGTLWYLQLLERLSAHQHVVARVENCRLPPSIAALKTTCSSFSQLGLHYLCHFALFFRPVLYSNIAFMWKR